MHTSGDRSHAPIRQGKYGHLLLKQRGLRTTFWAARPGEGEIHPEASGHAAWSLSPAGLMLLYHHVYQYYHGHHTVRSSIPNSLRSHIEIVKPKLDLVIREAEKTPLESGQ